MQLHKVAPSKLYYRTWQIFGGGGILANIQVKAVGEKKFGE